MRKLLLLGILFMLPAVSHGWWIFGKKKKPAKHFPVSRWKEVKRMTPDSVTVVPFKDTMFFRFRAKGQYSFRQVNGFVYNGPYTLTKTNLDIDFMDFKIRNYKGNKLVLDDSYNIHFFAIDSSDTVKTIELPKEPKPDPVKSIEQMVGHWYVYKCVVDKGSVDYAKKLKSAYITGPGSDGKLGFIFCADDKMSSPSLYIKSLTADQSLECNGKGLRIFKVVKCQKGEMVLEEEGVTYYFKVYN